MSPGENHLPGDPKQWVRSIEAIWQARDGVRASEGYTNDAVQIWGADRRQSGVELNQRAAKWFEYAKDLSIEKTYIAHTNDCIVTTWKSVYTNPGSGQKVHERGVELFYFRHGKICEQHVWQHSWNDGEVQNGSTFSTD